MPTPSSAVLRGAVLAALLGLCAPLSLRAEEPPAPSASGLVLRLLDAGAAPRRALRLRVPAGQRERTSMALRLSGQMGGQELPLPSMQVTALARVTAVEAERAIAYAVDFEALEVLPGGDEMPGLAEGLRRTQEVLRRARTEARVSTRGEVLALDFVLPEDTPAVLRTSLASMTESLRSSGPVLLPAEEVGLGARWEVAGTQTLNGAVVQQTMVYELEAREGARLTLAATVTQRAEAQRLRGPHLPPGVELEIVSIASTGTAALELDLARLMPVQVRMDLDSEQEMQMTSEGETQPIKMRMRLGLEATTVIVPAAASTPAPAPAPAPGPAPGR